MILWRDNNHEKRSRDIKKDDSSRQYIKFFMKSAIFDFLGNIIEDVCSPKIPNQIHPTPWFYRQLASTLNWSSRRITSVLCIKTPCECFFPLFDLAKRLALANSTLSMSVVFIYFSYSINDNPPDFFDSSIFSLQQGAFTDLFFLFKL